MNSDFWWAAEASERPRNSVAGALPWSPMASHRGTARDRLEEAVESQNPSRAGEPPRRRAKARQQQQQQARGQEKKADLTYQSNRVRPLNQSGVTPEIRQTTAPTREIRHLGTGGSAGRGYRCRRNVRGRSRFPRRRAGGEKGEKPGGGRTGEEPEDRDAKVKKKTFSLLSSLLESLFAVCTHALSLSRALAQAAAAFPSQQPPGPGRGRGGKGRVSRTLGGGGRRLN